MPRRRRSRRCGARGRIAARRRGLRRGRGAGPADRRGARPDLRLALRRSVGDRRGGHGGARSAARSPRRSGRSSCRSAAAGSRRGSASPRGRCYRRCGSSACSPSRLRRDVGRARRRAIWCRSTHDPTLADGLAGNIAAGSITFPLVRDTLDDVLTVPNVDRRAMLTFLDRHHLVVEGSGAVGLAALQEGLLHATPGPILLIVSGSNVATTVLAGVLPIASSLTILVGVGHRPARQQHQTFGRNRRPVASVRNDEALTRPVPLPTGRLSVPRPYRLRATRSPSSLERRLLRSQADPSSACHRTRANQPREAGVFQSPQAAAERAVGERPGVADVGHQIEAMARGDVHVGVDSSGRPRSRRPSSRARPSRG